jgi:hypothetical protein
VAAVSSEFGTKCAGVDSAAIPHLQEGLRVSQLHQVLTPVHEIGCIELISFQHFFENDKTF